jgi:lipoprotein Spr
MKIIIFTIALLLSFFEGSPQDFIKDKRYAGDPLYDFIVDWWGTSYKYGGTTKKGIDCSAFTLKLVKEVYEVTIPRTASQQYRVTKRVSKSELKDGDLVFFRTRGRSTWHVGVYITEGWFVHASSSSGVKFNNLKEKTYSRLYYGSGRLM